MVHSCGLAHMDVKPENIYVSRPEGTFKLGDFGLAVPRNGIEVETGDSRCPCLPSHHLLPHPFFASFSGVLLDAVLRPMRFYIPFRALISCGPSQSFYCLPSSQSGFW